MATDERWIVVPRWAEFQHYRDRRPLWIKNYGRLLHDHAYTELSLLERGALHGIWLLYSEAGGILSEELARRQLCASKSEAGRWRRTLDRLSDAGFLSLSASKPLAARYQNASLETEKEKEGSKGLQRASSSSYRPAASSSSTGTNRNANGNDCPTCAGDRLVLANVTNAGELYRPCPDCGVRESDEPSRSRTHASSSAGDVAGELERLEPAPEGRQDA